MFQRNEQPIRQRRRLADGSTEFEPGPVDDSDTPRLRAVQIMVLEGKTQDEIAEYFNRAPRTIRRWLAEARRRRIVTLKGLTPHDLLSTTFLRYQQIEAELHRVRRAAMDAGDRRSALESIRQLRHTERDKYIVLEKAGFFENFQFLQPSAEVSPNEVAAHRLVQMAQEFLARGIGRAGEETDLLPDLLIDHNEAAEDDPEPFF